MPWSETKVGFVREWCYNKNLNLIKWYNPLTLYRNCCELNDYKYKMYHYKIYKPSPFSGEKLHKFIVWCKAGGIRQKKKSSKEESSKHIIKWNTQLKKSIFHSAFSNNWCREFSYFPLSTIDFCCVPVVPHYNVFQLFGVT